MCKWQVSLTSPYNTPLLPAKQTIRISVSYTENDQKFSTLPIAIKCMMFSPSLKGSALLTVVENYVSNSLQNYQKGLTWIFPPKVMSYAYFSDISIFAPKINVRIYTYSTTYVRVKIQMRHFWSFSNTLKCLYLAFHVKGRKLNKTDLFSQPQRK